MYIVLSLDIAGAFDTVNHTRLLDNLRKKGIPYWFVRTLKSFLTDRSTTLIVDREETTVRKLNVSIPQGSPLSLILFLFYNAPLLKKLYYPDIPLMLLRFADDINLLIYKEATIVNCLNLELVYNYCLD